MPVELVAAGVGNPKYLVIEPAGPWVAEDIGHLVAETVAFDQAEIFLLTPKPVQVVPVHVESTDGYPDFLDWEVTLPGEGGELVERAEFDGADADHLDTAEALGRANRTVNVNGWI